MYNYSWKFRRWEPVTESNLADTDDEIDTLDNDNCLFFGGKLL